MDKPLSIRLFGGFAVRVGDEVVSEGAWRLRKGRSLVKLLALAPDRRMHRERAAEWLWPDRSAEAAANNFHQALYVARRALEGAGAHAATVLPLRDDMLMLHPGGGVAVDLDAFEAAAARARETGSTPDLRAAIALHGGELLPEDRFEPWATARRAAVGETYMALLLALSAALSREGDALGAVELLERAVVLDPLHEAAQRALMRLFAADGRRQQALAQYHHLRDALKHQLEAEPDPQTAQLYRALLRGEEAPDPVETERVVPRPRSAGPVEHAPLRHNLPIALTSFVGRDRELAEVTRLLDRDRLLTLTGAGGAGKTRLATEAARTRAHAYPDGVWLVGLAGLRDPALVAATTASALGLTLPSQRLDIDGLAAQLAGRRALIVLDNCEHLIAACADLTGLLLATCPGLSVLATSREPLRVPGEVTWRVPSLALPARDCPADADGLLLYESVRLFCERASDAAPGFALTAANAAAVAEICRRLDGMPLALELAAARAGSLSPGQIAERLGDSLAVLTAGSRSALDRQQTLRATLNWSHALLTDCEAVQFRRLSVFAGGFTLEGAEEVTSGGGVDRSEVADLVGQLVDKSLVVAEEGGGGYRYRLLEPMRQYAYERLVAAGEPAAVEERHLGSYLDLARAADPETGAATAGASGLEADHDNLRAALAWALRHEPERGLQLAVHMWPMWMAGGHFAEGSRWLNSAVTAVPGPTALRAEALRAASGLLLRLGRTAQMGALGDERVAIFRELGDRRAVAHALDESGVYHYMLGHHDRAESLYAESRALADEIEDRKVAAAVLHSQAVLAQCRADFEGARENLLASLARLDEIDPGDSEPFFRVHTVGLFVAAEGPAGAPRMYFEETAQFFRRVDARRAAGYVLAGLGDVARAEGYAEPARERLAESLAHFRELRDPMGTAFALNRLGILAGVRGEHDLAREWLEEGLAIRRELGDRRAEGMTLGNLGVLDARAGDIRGARARLGEALALFEDTDDAPGRAGMRLNLGNIAADRGDHETALRLLEEAWEHAAQQRLFRAAGWAALTAAEVATAAGDTARAAGLLAAARDHLRPLGDRWGVGRWLELREAAAKPALSPRLEG